MSIRVKTFAGSAIELPLRLRFNFGAMVRYWEELAAEPHPMKSAPARELLERLRTVPDLLEPFDDLSIIEQNASLVQELFAPLFPAPLQHNEIKALGLGFLPFLFLPTKRFQNILNRAGEDFVIDLSGLVGDEMYISACVTILSRLFSKNVELKTPFYLNIPDNNKGIMRRYRAMFNVDYLDIYARPDSPRLTNEQVNQLIDNIHDIQLWKTLIPPESFDLDGFGIVSLFDVTDEEALSEMKNILLQRQALESAHHRETLTKLMRRYLNIAEIDIGFASFDEETKEVRLLGDGDWTCMSLTEDGVLDSSECFCSTSFDEIFDKHGVYVVSDIAREDDASPLIARMRGFNMGSFIVAPLMYDDRVMGFLEVTAPTPGRLNTLVAKRLANVLPLFTVAMQRAIDERETQLEAIVQEKYTALHPSISWRFFQVAENVLSHRLKGEPDPADDVVFRDVMPLYGQFDIRGSSIARNIAIQADLVRQLGDAERVMDTARESSKLPIYDHLRFRIQRYRNDLQNGINAGDEVKILDFLRTEIYPVFHHLSAQQTDLAHAVNTYMQNLDPLLHVIYDERKRYEDTVTAINEFVSQLIEAEQVRAQEMFPHYFEKYKTDGVEYNLYIGQSMQPKRPYDPLYLSNMRLWQLLLAAHVENKFRQMHASLPMQLEITSLILAHNSPLSIKFREDEKTFDVDGAYNIRYEIIKKRIDKAFIKNTQERLTQPGKLVIVYSQDEEAAEYLQYLEYMQALGILAAQIETVELEDLQGTTGLRALRTGFLYGEQPADHLAVMYEKAAMQERG